MPSESVVACDDGHVKKLGKGYTIVSCVRWDIGRGPVASSIRPVRVDGLEAGSIIAGLLHDLYSPGTSFRALLLDSITIAGFNIVSPSTIEKLAGVPTVVVYKYKPSKERLIKPVKEKFRDWRVRVNVLALVERTEEVGTRLGRLFIIAWGLSLEEAIELIGRLQLYSRIPEPLRLAHYTASSISRLLEAELLRL